MVYSSSPPSFSLSFFLAGGGFFANYYLNFSLSSSSYSLILVIIFKCFLNPLSRYLITIEIKGAIIFPIKGTKLFVTIANDIVAPLLKYQLVSKSVYLPYKNGKIFKRLLF
jgi:hypothetical protein